VRYLSTCADRPSALRAISGVPVCLCVPACRDAAPLPRCPPPALSFRALLAPSRAVHGPSSAPSPTPPRVSLSAPSPGVGTDTPLCPIRNSANPNSAASVLTTKITKKDGSKIANFSVFFAFFAVKIGLHQTSNVTPVFVRDAATRLADFQIQNRRRSSSGIGIHGTRPLRSETGRRKQLLRPCGRRGDDER
jgi:hypothetical protein